MPKRWRDRWALRQMQRQFNKKSLDHQTNYMATLSHISPEWLHQSRKNFHYIYTNPTTYWPDWAVTQYMTPSGIPTPSVTEFSCLNTAYQSTFNYTHPQKNWSMGINTNGFIAFPTHLWGIVFAVSNGTDPPVPLFQQAVSLSPDTMTIVAHSSTDLGTVDATFVAGDTLKMALTMHPSSTNTMVLHCGIVPLTNMGVGAISNIQYTSHHQCIVNDRAVVSVSQPPDNVVCANYNAGDIFTRSLSCQMILNTTCPHQLASGMMAFDGPRDGSRTILFECHLLTSFFMPLMPPGRPRRYPALDAYSITPASFEAMSFKPIHQHHHRLCVDPHQSKKIALILGQLALHHPPIESLTLDTFYYELRTALHLKSTAVVQALATAIANNLSATMTREQQTTLFCANQYYLMATILTLDLLHRFRVSSAAFGKKTIVKLVKKITRDPFILYLKKMNDRQFLTAMRQPSGYDMALKIIIFSSLINKLMTASPLADGLATYQTMCHTYLTRITQSSPTITTILQPFYDTTRLPLNLKLFISSVFLRPVLPGSAWDRLVEGLSSGWHHNHFFSGPHAFEFCERTELIFSCLTSPDQQWAILNDYLDHINALGLYENLPLCYRSYRDYPHTTHHYHAVFLTIFFDCLFQTDQNNLMITMPMWVTTGHIDSVTTAFGDVCVTLDTNADQITMQFTHSFHSPPQSVQLRCPPEYHYVSFNKPNQAPTKIKNGWACVPLNESIIYVTKSM